MNDADVHGMMDPQISRYPDVVGPSVQISRTNLDICEPGTLVQKTGKLEISPKWSLCGFRGPRLLLIWVFSAEDDKN